MNPLNRNEIFEEWAPLIESSTGVKDRYKLNWLSEYCNNHAKYEGAELIAFNRAADDRPPESSDELRHYEMILLKIYNSNRTRPIFYQQVLQLIAARRFRARCREALLKNKSWGRYYWRSKLRPFDAVTLREKAGLIFRSLSSL